MQSDSIQQLHIHKFMFTICLQYCNENPIYVFRKLRGLSPNFNIHVSMSDLYIPRICPYRSYSRIGRSIVGIYKWLGTGMCKFGLWPRSSFSRNICFEFSVLVLCSECPCRWICTVQTYISCTWRVLRTWAIECGWLHSYHLHTSGRGLEQSKTKQAKHNSARI